MNDLERAVMAYQRVQHAEREVDRMKADLDRATSGLSAQQRQEWAARTEALRHSRDAHVPPV
jgi:hypothetical protein